MPVLSKVNHRILIKELRTRFSALESAFTSRDLKSSTEGAARGSWVKPGCKCATTSSALTIRLAVDDFKNILSEIRKLK